MQHDIITYYPDVHMLDQERGFGDVWFDWESNKYLVWGADMTMDLMRFIDVYGLGSVKCTEEQKKEFAEAYYHYCCTQTRG